MADLYSKNSSGRERNNFIIKTSKYSYNFLSIPNATVNEYPINSITIGIVRNPYERFSEIFIYILKGWKKIGTKMTYTNIDQIYNLFIEHNIQKPIDIFNQDPFVRDKILKFDVFKHQNYFLCDTKYNIMVDYLYKFKDYSKLYSFLKNKINRKFKFIKSDKYNKKTSELKIKLSKEEKEHVYNYYKADFVIFNYPK